jgi:hypothetical protein
VASRSVETLVKGRDSSGNQFKLSAIQRFSCVATKIHHAPHTQVLRIAYRNPLTYRIRNEAKRAQDVGASPPRIPQISLRLNGTIPW